MATTYITRTPAGTGNQRTFTMSYWLKRAAQGVGDNFYSQSGGKCYLEFTSGDFLNIGMNTSGTSVDAIKTNRVFRDPAAWYNIVLKMDTTQSVAADRMRLYINGVEEVAANWSTTNYPAEDADILINTTLQYYIGSQTASTNYFSGEMSHVQFVDGTALAPTEFGEVDATSGIWKIKTSAYSTPGTNGFYLKMEDRTNLDLDSSSNAFTFTTSGTLTATYDNPSDNFCTLHKLNPQAYPSAVTNGNLTTQSASDSTYRSIFGTLANSTGKYYFETECDAVGSGAAVGIIGTEDQLSSNSSFGTQSTGYSYKSDGNKENNSSATSYGATYTSGDIIGCALDLTNGTIWFSKNGAWQNSATIGEIAAGTTTNAAYSSITTEASKFYSPAFTGIVNQIWKINFGNGYFGTTAISSAGTNASGIGSFEYDVPTNFTAISTKGFNE